MQAHPSGTIVRTARRLEASPRGPTLRPTGTTLRRLRATEMHLDTELLLVDSALLRGDSALLLGDSTPLPVDRRFLLASAKQLRLVQDVRSALKGLLLPFTRGQTPCP